MILSLNDIHKSFGPVEVLRGITLEIDSRQITTITGASGAGKTTLLQIMGTLLPPDSGTVMYDGRDVTHLREKEVARVRSHRIGFVFQFHQLLPEFTAIENVMLPAQIAGTSRREARRHAAELLDILGLSSRFDHKPAALSGGERQRVAVARALINQPDIVFADEPTGSLDTHARDEICALFTRLHTELSQGFVIVTHDTELASLGQRHIPLCDGRIL